MRHALTCALVVAGVVGCKDAQETPPAKKEATSQPTRAQPQLRASPHRVGELTAATEQNGEAVANAFPSFSVAKTSWPRHVDPTHYDSFCLYQGSEVALFLQHGPVGWSVSDLAGHLVDEHGAGIGTTYAELERSIGELWCDGNPPVLSDNACVMVWRSSPFKEWRRLVRCTSDSRAWFDYWFDAPEAEAVRASVPEDGVKVPAQHRAVMVTAHISPETIVP